MRPLILVGLLAAAGLTILGCGGSLLVAAIVFSASDQGSYPAGYDPAFNSMDTYPIVDPQSLGASPADRWPNDGQWNGHISHGTVDPTGQGNDVISLDGEVLNLPY